MSDVDLSDVDLVPDAGEVATNGSAAPEAVAPREGVEYLPDGRVKFWIDNRPHILRRPKVGEFRTLHTKMTDAVNLPVGEQLDTQIRWVLKLFELSDHPLPGANDEWPVEEAADGKEPKTRPPDAILNEWPTWLATATWQGKVLVHFRDVPLAPGGSAE